jgi:hypothetical protein
MIFMKLDFISQNEKAPLVNRPLQNQLKRLRVTRTAIQEIEIEDSSIGLRKPVFGFAEKL